MYTMGMKWRNVWEFYTLYSYFSKIISIGVYTAGAGIAVSQDRRFYNLQSTIYKNLKQAPGI